MNSLSKKQRRVVECLDNCLVVACPGSGKTRVLVKKVKHILQNDSGARILITSFTKDSASEIRTRTFEEFKESGMDAKTEIKKVISGTFHSIAFDQLKRSGFNGSIISAGQMRLYAQRAITESKLHDMEIDDAMSVIEMAKLDPNFEPGNDDHGKLFMAYTELTTRNNVIDFGDMLSRAVRGMRDKSIAPKDINYLLTDESQDLDEMQYAWCVEHITQQNAKFTVVGDDDQSIYKFRKALGYEGMMRFMRDFGAELIKLDTNYRCRSEIMGSAGRVIANNTNRVDKELEAIRGPGGSTHVYWCGDAETEAMLIAGKILDVCENNPNPPEGALIEVLENEWAVLARNNLHLESVMLALDSYWIPYNHSGKSLWDDAPICLVIGLLGAIRSTSSDKHSEEEKKARKAKQKSGYDMALHYSGIDEETLIELHNRFGDDFSTLFHDDKVDLKGFGKGTTENLEKFRENISQWAKCLDKDRVGLVVAGAFDWFIDHLNASSTDKAGKGLYFRDLNRLLTAKKIMLNMTGDLTARLMRIMSRKDKKDNNGKKSVYLGTLHSSKGLEFNNVWLMRIDDGVIPDNKERDSVVWTPALDEEERRLFYVGMTRAKDRLFISATKQPSMFIAETGLPVMNIFKEEEEDTGD